MVLLEKDNGLQCYFNGNHWNFYDGFYWASILFLAGWTPKVVVGDGDVRNLKKRQDKTNVELHFFDIKGIKIMASDVINYKYHIKSMSLW